MEPRRPDGRVGSRDGEEMDIAYKAGRALAAAGTGIQRLGRVVGPALVTALGAVTRSVRASAAALRRRRERRRARLSPPAPPAWLPPSARGRPPRRRRRRGPRLLAAGFAGLTLIVAVSFGGWVWAVQDVPVQQVIEGPSHAAIILEDRDGEVFARRGPIMGPPVTRTDLPDHLVAAVLAIEDRRFDRHFGVDPIGVARAFMSNWRAGHIVEGGSTITQQLAKLSLGEGDRTWERKVQESALALWLETRLSKDEILARYLNNIYMGSGVIGISGAARFYFGKEVDELTLAESAMLAGMIHAPSRRNPLHNWESARVRANMVLDAMAADGAIDAAEVLAAKASPAEPDPFAHAGGGSWFADWMLAEIADRIGSFEAAIRVRTTLHPEAQRIAEEVVERLLAEQGEAHRFSQAALVAMRPDGAVVAMVGGRDYGESQFNRATRALRQPGSAFKTFVYLAALREGYGLDSVLRDEPVDIGGWRPTNYGGRFHGRVSLADAFTHSLNAATVRLGHEVGLDNVIRAARDLGIETELTPNPSLPLGTSEVTLLDLTAAYASIRGGRMPVRPWGMAELGREGEEDRFPVGPGRTRLQPLDHRDEMVQLMERVVRHGTGRRAAIDGFAAGKTGTSQGFRDAWFVGFTDELVVGVWVGNDDASPMARGLVGGAAPALAWREFVSQAGPLLGEGPQLAMAPSGRSLSDLVPELPLAEEADAMDLPEDAGTQAWARWAGQSAAGWGQRMPCDVEACDRRYRSFRASDCTYQPYRGSRQVCPIPPRDAGPQAPGELAFVRPPGAGPMQAARPQAAQCDIAACDRRYRSFRASDCTYQPYRGSRRVCPIGPRTAAGEARAQASRAARPPGFQCNVQACDRAYRSFRLSDCTYQPYRGPRRLCTR